MEYKSEFNLESDYEFEVDPVGTSDKSLDSENSGIFDIEGSDGSSDSVKIKNVETEEGEILEDVIIDIESVVEDKMDLAAPKSLPSKMISLKSAPKRDLPSLQLSLAQLTHISKANEEFFENSWCFKKDSEFMFDIGQGRFNRQATTLHATGKRNGEGTEARMINFDREFGGWVFSIGSDLKSITGCHIRVDRELPRKQEDYQDKPPFHITLEFEGRDDKLHFRFNEQGKKVGREWRYPININDDETYQVYQAVIKLAEQFVGQIQVRWNKIAALSSPKINLTAHIRHTIHHPKPVLSKEGHKNSPIKPKHESYSSKPIEHRDTYRGYREKFEEKRNTKVHDARHDKRDERKYPNRY